MNIIIEAVGFIVAGVGITLVYNFIKSKVIKGVKQVPQVAKVITEAQEHIITPITNAYAASPLSEKLKHDLYPTKIISTYIRLIPLVIIIMGVIFAYGYWKGQSGKPVNFNLGGKEAVIKLNEHFLRIDKFGNASVVDKEGKILKTIKVKDIPALEKALRPYGLMLEPIAVIGGGLSNVGGGFEGGIGVRYLKYYKWVADICITNGGAYPFGLSYKLTDNSAAGISVGTGYKNMERGLFERVLLKFSMKF